MFFPCLAPFLWINVLSWDKNHAPIDFRGQRASSGCLDVETKICIQTGLTWANDEINNTPFVIIIVVLCVEKQNRPHTFSERLKSSLLQAHTQKNQNIIWYFYNTDKAENSPTHTLFLSLSSSLSDWTEWIDDHQALGRGWVVGGSCDHKSDWRGLGHNHGSQQHKPKRCNYDLIPARKISRKSKHLAKDKTWIPAYVDIYYNDEAVWARENPPHRDICGLFMWNYINLSNCFKSLSTPPSSFLLSLSLYPQALTINAYIRPREPIVKERF